MKIKNFKLKISKYVPSEIESKWQVMWEKSKVYSPNLDSAKKPFGFAQGKPFYNLMMFPYPSAEGMHVGNMYAFTGSDIYGRFKRMQGFNVFEPIGLDGFGIHSENYAIKVGKHPKEQAKVSEANFYRQLHATGNGFDWSRTVETYDPDYYKWTQWIFIQLFKAGLAYRKKSPVNFCPSCKTVLADEQVIDGKCERCSSIVEKKDLEQWFFKITTYADRLLNNLKDLDWTPKVKIAQENWIGRSEGARIEFKVQSSKFKVQVFTTAIDTIYGVTFMAISPEHSLSASIEKKEVKEYIQQAKQKTDQERTKEKTGVDTGLVAINPINNEQVPVWIADYVLMGYGTGAIMGVPGHDARDYEFAKKYKLSIKPVIKPTDDSIKVSEDGFWNYEDIKKNRKRSVLFSSGEFDGLKSDEAKRKFIEYIEKNGFGKKEVQYHLRDWLISRQRYWGPPIPMIYCEKCKWQPVPEKDLPVLLPDISDWKPKGTGESPLASVPSFVKTKCPSCGGEARRETDVSDTFLDSAWYFLRYLATDRDDIPFPMEKSKIKNQKSKIIGNLKLEIGNSAQRAAWLPVNMYIGGAEHSVLHLLYSRFLTMVFKDLGFISFEEPFTTFRAHGLLISGGVKMSKSKGNVVIPDQYIKKYGADTLRTYLMFAGPFEQGGDFIDTGIEGMFRFLNRVWRLVVNNCHPEPIRPEGSRPRRLVSGSSSGGDEMPKPFGFAQGGQVRHDTERVLHKTIKKVTEDIENLHYNTAISALMEYYNSLHAFYTKYKILDTIYCKTLILLLAPFAPHMSEELWQHFRSLEVRNGKLLTPEVRNLESLNQEVKTSRTQGQEFRTSNFKNSKFESIHLHPWPSYDPKMLKEDEVTIVVQVNGKVRDTFKVSSFAKASEDKQRSILRQSSGRAIKDQRYVEERAKESERVKKYLEGKIVKKVVYVEGKIINFVIE
ncbi:MAG: leucine--tRNA ligase [bacterium]|nr:leucine--tRNA ligase [bacterium]